MGRNQRPPPEGEGVLMRAIVIGAGIGGLAAGVALARAGIDVRNALIRRLSPRMQTRQLKRIIQYRV